jgi:hypothetical protein
VTGGVKLKSDPRARSACIVGGSGVALGHAIIGKRGLEGAVAVSEIQSDIRVVIKPLTPGD